MALMSRKLVVSLLLVLVLCNAAFVAHAASHLSGEFVDCELCISHSPLSHGLTNTNTAVTLPPFEGILQRPTHQTFNNSFSRSSFARGPPTALDF